MKNILLIEDNEDFALVAKKYAPKEWNLVHVKDGDSAWDQLSLVEFANYEDPLFDFLKDPLFDFLKIIPENPNTIDGIITDLFFPSSSSKPTNYNGKEVLQHLKEIDPYEQAVQNILNQITDYVDTSNICVEKYIRNSITDKHSKRSLDERKEILLRFFRNESRTTKDKLTTCKLMLPNWGRSKYEVLEHTVLNNLSEQPEGFLIAHYSLMSKNIPTVIATALDRKALPLIQYFLKAKWPVCYAMNENRKLEEGYWTDAYGMLESRLKK